MGWRVGVGEGAGCSILVGGDLNDDSSSENLSACQQIYY